MRSFGARLVACRPPARKPMSGRFRKQRTDPANRFASCVNLRRTAAQTFAADRRMAGSYRIVPDRFLVLGKRQVQRLANCELRAGLLGRAHIKTAFGARAQSVANSKRKRACPPQSNSIKYLDFELVSASDFCRVLNHLE